MDVDRRTYLHAKVEQFDVSNVIYHKFSHSAISYTLNRENVNIMLELHYTCSSFNPKLLITHIKFSGIFLRYISGIFLRYK